MALWESQHVTQASSRDTLIINYPLNTHLLIVRSFFSCFHFYIFLFGSILSFVRCVDVNGDQSVSQFDHHFGPDWNTLTTTGLKDYYEILYSNSWSYSWWNPNIHMYMAPRGRIMMTLSIPWLFSLSQIQILMYPVMYWCMSKSAVQIGTSFSTDILDPQRIKPTDLSDLVSGPFRITMIFVFWLWPKGL